MVFSAGAHGGGYWGVAERLREVAAESGLKVRVSESAGSMQNLQRLSDPSSEFNLGLAQADAIEHYLKGHPGLENRLRIMESIGLECVFMITVAESGIHTIQDLFSGENRRIAIPSPDSGVTITYRYMTDLIPELAKTEPVFIGTDEALESMRGGTPAADVVMLVHRPKVRSGGISRALDDPARFRFVSIEDDRLTKAPARGQEGIYSFLDVPLVRGAPGRSKSIPTICTKGRLLAAPDKLSGPQLEGLKRLMDFQWMRIYPTER